MADEVYLETVQVDIDTIIDGGNISTHVDTISSLFNSIATVYVGTDGKLHRIAYTPYSYQSGLGYLPVGTDTSSLYLPDKTQFNYKMTHLINYVNAYNALAPYASSSNTEYTVLNSSIYGYYINSYNNLKKYFSYFVSSYDVKLYSYVSSLQSLTTELNAIKTQLFYPTSPEPNFVNFVENLIKDFAETTPAKIAQAEQAVYIISRNIAFSKRKTRKNLRIP
jgi:hypothetical protein